MQTPPPTDPSASILALGYTVAGACLAGFYVLTSGRPGEATDWIFALLLCAGGAVVGYVLYLTRA